MQFALLEDTKFESNEWTLKGHSSTIFLDFKLFDLPHTRFMQSNVCNFEGVTYEISPIDVAKVVIASRGMGSDQSSALFKNLLCVYAFLTEQGKTKVEREDWADLYSYIMGNSVTENGTVSLHSIKSFKSGIGLLNPRSTNQCIDILGIEPIFSDMSQKEHNKALNEACLATAGMTAKDYIEGSSFNFLTLDVGRHYIDYCADYFEEFYPLAFASNATLASAPSEINSKVKKANGQSRPLALSENYIHQIAQAIRGVDIMKCPDLSGSKNSKGEGYNCFGEPVRQIMQDTVQSNFFKHYSYAYNLIEPFKIDNVQAVARILKLPEMFDTHEFIRSMIFSDRTDQELGKS
jgi:hypothetical protein